MKNERIMLTDSRGCRRVFNVLFTFKSDDFHKSYILIYPCSTSSRKRINVRAYSLPFDEDPANPDTGKLKPIKTKQEWDLVESVLDVLIGRRS